MNLEVGKKYKTKCGNTIFVRHIEPVEGKKPKVQCLVESIVAGHESLKSSVQFYSPEGQWLAYPGGIHDVEGEAV